LDQISTYRLRLSEKLEVIFLAVVMLIVAQGVSAQRTIYVDHQALGLNSGADWQNAFVSLHDAIGAARSGDDIWIAEGVYPTSSVGNRFASYDLDMSLSIYGGFRGFEETVEERGPNAITVLSGEIGLPGERSDNAHHVLEFSNPNLIVTIDGLSIEGAYGDFEGEADFELDETGAVLIDNPANSTMSILFRNVNFQHNFAKDKGGAVFVQDKSNSNTELKFIGCSFHDNVAIVDGSAVYGNLFSSQAQIEFSRISMENIDPTHQSFTAIQLLFRGQENLLRIEDSFFGENRTVNPDPILAFGLFGKTDFFLENTTFVNNTYGQVMFVNSNSGDQANQVVIKDVKLLHNETFSSPLQILNTAFGQNRSDVHIDGLTIDNNINGDTWILLDLHEINLRTFDNNTFTNNKGGPLFLNPVYSDLTINNLLVANNSFLDVDFTNQFVFKNFDNYDITFNNATFAYNEGVKGTAVRTFFNENNGRVSQLTFNNSIFFGNTDFGQGFSPELLIYASYTDVIFNNSLLDASICENVADITARGQVICDNTNLINADPFFRSTSDFRLDHCSPAIDAGDNILSEEILRDIANQERVINDRVDIGAYENIPVTRDFGFTCSQGLLYSDWLPDFDDGATFEYVKQDYEHLLRGQGRYVITTLSGCVDTVIVDVLPLSGVEIGEVDDSQNYAFGDTVSISAINYLSNEVDWILYYEEERIPFERIGNTVEFIIRGGGIYNLIVVNEFGCMRSVEIAIPEVNFDDLLYLPNSISPNGDGLNDDWVISTQYSGEIEIKSFNLFNRWGNPVASHGNILFENEVVLVSGEELINQQVEGEVLIYVFEVEVEGRSLTMIGDVTIF